MTNETPATIRPDWRGLTERIRAWQAPTFPGVTEEVGKWRTVNELAELGKKIASGAPIAEIHEEAADVIITIQHERRAEEFLPYQRARDHLLDRVKKIGVALMDGDIELALMRTMTIFPTEAAAFAEVERKFAIVQARVWDIGADGTGQHAEALETSELIAELKSQNHALSQTVERVRAEMTAYQNLAATKLVPQNSELVASWVNILNGKDG